MPDAGGRHTQSSANLPLLIPKPEKNPCRKARGFGGRVRSVHGRRRVSAAAPPSPTERSICLPRTPATLLGSEGGWDREGTYGGDDVLFYGSEPKILLGVF